MIKSASFLIGLMPCKFGLFGSVNIKCRIVKQRKKKENDKGVIQPNTPSDQINTLSNDFFFFNECAKTLNDKLKSIVTS